MLIIVTTQIRCATECAPLTGDISLAIDQGLRFSGVHIDVTDF